MAITVNKSLLTNVITVVIIGLGFYLNDIHIKTMGYYALSGAITNWLAIYMLFERVPFLYGSGVIPKHFNQFKEGIRALIMEEFFTRENIERLMKNSQKQLSLDSDVLMATVDFDKVFESLVQVILNSSFGNMLNMVGGESALTPLKEPIIDKLKNQIVLILQDPNTQTTLLEQLSGTSDRLLEQVELILQQRLDELTPTHVKQIIQKMIRKHLGWLVVWGGVFGAALGLIVSNFAL